MRIQDKAKPAAGVKEREPITPQVVINACFAAARDLAFAEKRSHAFCAHIQAVSENFRIDLDALFADDNHFTGLIICQDRSSSRDLTW